jgi:hypothetical protein
MKKAAAGKHLLRLVNQAEDYFAGGGFSPVFLTVVSCVVVVEPPLSDAFVSTFFVALSPQPTRPIERMLNTITDARIRFMFFHSLSEGI